MANRKAVRTGENEVACLAVGADPFGVDVRALTGISVPIIAVKYGRPETPWFRCIVDAELVFAAGLSFWVYIVAWIIVPQKPLAGSIAGGEDDSAGMTNSETMSEPEATDEASDKTKMIIGVVLIALGFIFLLNTFNFLVWFSFFKLWPIIIIVIGVLILVKSIDRRAKDES